MELIGQLTEPQYLAWQLKLAKIEVKEANLKAAQMQHAMILKDLELNKLKAELFKHNAIQSLGDQVVKLREEYQKFLDEHEKVAGYSLRGMLINEDTYEVFKELDTK
jgi:hypothetical protein